MMVIFKLTFDHQHCQSIASWHNNTDHNYLYFRFNLHSYRHMLGDVFSIANTCVHLQGLVMVT